MEELLENEEKESSGIGSKIIRGLKIGIIVVPLLIFIILYFRNPGFKAGVHNRLSKAPGFVGSYFREMPTEEEDQDRVEYLANYFLGLDPGVAADKIYIIKEENDKLYTDIIRSMNQISVDKTQDVLVKVRDLSRRKDLLSSVYDDAKQDELMKQTSEASRIESQDILVSKTEIERRFSSREFQEILKEVQPKSLANILYYIDMDIRGYLLDIFDNDKRLEIESEIGKIHNEHKALIEIAKFYETKPVDKSMEVLGNTDSYSIEKLSVIFKNMSVLKSADILAEINDEEFIEELFSGIMDREELEGSEKQITRDISNSIEFLKEYKGKIGHLVRVYAEMNPSHVAEIVEQMVDNDETITIFDIDMDNRYELSDRVIIIDILSDLKRDQVSKVLDVMEPDKASFVTQLLAKPEMRNYEGGEREDGVVEEQ